MQRVLLVFALAACGRTGELRHHYTIEPPVSVTTGDRDVHVKRISGPMVTGVRTIPRLWVELELANRDAADWVLRATEIVLEKAHPAGFATVPTIIDGEVSDKIVVGAHATTRVWVRFDGVDVQNPIAARAGVDAPAAISLRVGERELQLSDPLRGAPLWNPPAWPYFTTLALGFAGSFGESDATARRGGMTLDVALTVNRRFGELDAGIVGVLRAGVDVVRIGDAMQAAGFGAIGGGATAGYTIPLGPVYLRPATSMVLVRAGHGQVETTSAWLAGELQVGVARRGLYPFRSRPAAYTIGAYLRGEGRVATFSDMPEPFGFTLAIGMVMRGGS